MAQFQTNGCGHAQLAGIAILRKCDIASPQVFPSNVVMVMSWNELASSSANF